MTFYVFYLILSDFLRQTVKEFALTGKHRMVGDGEGWAQDGENVLAGEHEFNLVKTLLMKFCSVRNKSSFQTDASTT